MNRNRFGPRVNKMLTPIRAARMESLRSYLCTFWDDCLTLDKDGYRRPRALGLSRAAVDAAVNDLVDAGLATVTPEVGSIVISLTVAGEEVANG